MNLMTISEAADQLGLARYIVRDRVEYGRLPATKMTRLGCKRATWMVDLAAAREHFEAHPPRELRPRRAIATVAAAPAGELTTMQLSVLESEHWHTLIEMLPDRRYGPGAFRCAWSDGESYTLLPNGEQEKYRYVLVAQDMEDEDL